MAKCKPKTPRKRKLLTKKDIPSFQAAAAVLEAAAAQGLLLRKPTLFNIKRCADALRAYRAEEQRVN